MTMAQFAGDQQPTSLGSVLPSRSGAKGLKANPFAYTNSRETLERLTVSVNTRRRVMTRILHESRRAFWFVVAMGLAVLAVPAMGQLPSRDISDSNLTDAERRETTLLWLDSFMTESDLLRPQDMAKIREAVSQMSPSQLQQWLEQTKQLREYVESDKWQQTKRWLREFLRVQAIYSDEEIQKLRDQIVRSDANQILAILKRIQAKHDSLVWMHQASERSRQIEVSDRDAYVAEQAAAAQAARVASVGTPPAPSGAAGGTAQKPSKGYQVPGPLIDSREMARAAVWAEVWGPGLLIGF